MEDGDIIDVHLFQVGDIGLFGQHSGSCGSELLQDERALLAASASDAKRIVDKLCPAGTPGKRGIVVGGEGVVLNSCACAALVGFVDELRRGETPHARIDVSHGKHDEHVQLSPAELQQLVGTEQAQRLVRLYQSPIDKVTRSLPSARSRYGAWLPCHSTTGLPSTPMSTRARQCRSR